MAESFPNMSRAVFDARDEISYAHVSGPGLSDAVVRTISASQNEPDWMLELRLRALDTFRSKPIPTW